MTSKKYFKGVITLPLNKKKIIEIDKNFIGQTEYFQKLDKKKTSNMMFIKNKLLITTLTTHIEIQNVNKVLSRPKLIHNKIIKLDETLKKYFGIKNPKMIISGINPHSGENGKIGKGEIKNLIPAIKKLKKNNINIEGPVSGDAMLNKKNMKYYDCFIFCFHDQALIPFKLLSNYSGINYTAGLDIIRVSPDHGTAYDIVGKKIAKIDSLNNCFKFINKIK